MESATASKNYKSGFDENGLFVSYIVDMHADTGIAKDLSIAILERALFHAKMLTTFPT